MLKKLAMTALAVSVVFAGGCQPSSPAAGPAPATGVASEAKKVRIGVSIPAADHGWTAGVKWWADEAVKLYPNVEWNVQTADSPQTQISQIETMMAQGIDGLVVLATESAPLTQTAEKVAERGIFLVNVDRGFLKPVADVFIEGDNQAFGRTSAEFMVKKLNGQGSIIVLEGIPSTVNTDRVTAAKEVFDANPGIKILDSQPGNWNRQKAFEVTQALLVKHPKVDAIWASDDDMALGVEQALKEAGRSGVWILGGAGMKDIVKRVMDKDPLFPANVTYPPSMIAQGIFVAANTLSNPGADKIKQFMPRHIKIDVDLITPENAKDFYFPDSIY
jgi:ribose transport system substrate-binding protein